MADQEKQPRKDRKEFLATLSASVIVIDSCGQYTLLVKNKRTKKWGLPAGGLKVNPDGTLETIDEVAKRELLEETGLSFDKDSIWTRPPRIVGVINLSSPDKNRIGIVYSGHLKYNASDPMYRSHDLPLNLDSLDKDEISKVKFFRIREVNELIEQNDIHRPEFNIGILKWAQDNLLFETPMRAMGRILSDPDQLLNERVLKNLTD